MVLQIGTHRRHIVQHLHANGLQMRRRSNARNLQQMRRINRATGHDHLARNPQFPIHPILPKRHTHALLAVEQQLRGNRVRLHPQIRSPLRRRQKRSRGGPTPLPNPRHLRIADAFLLLAIQILAEFMPGFLRRFHERMRQWQDRAVILYLQFAALAAECAVAFLHVIFRLTEIRQHIVKTPAARAHLRPAIEIRRIAAHIQHAVDGG